MHLNPSLWRQKLDTEFWKLDSNLDYMNRELDNCRKYYLALEQEAIIPPAAIMETYCQHINEIVARYAKPPKNTKVGRGFFILVYLILGLCMLGYVYKELVKI